MTTMNNALATFLDGLDVDVNGDYEYAVEYAATWIHGGRVPNVRDYAGMTDERARELRNTIERLQTS